MKGTDAIKEIMHNQGISQGVLAKRVGAKDNITINKRLKMENISLKLLDEMAKALGYKVILMPDTQRTPTDSYEVE